MDLKRAMPLAVVAVLGWSTALWAHCEIPCGIYGDELRFSMIMEDITTIEKSMKQITELAGKAGNANQVARWVNNKEDHADHIRQIVTQYFLTQRIKPVEAADSAGRKRYLKRLELLHKMLVYAMKCKQTTDLENVRTLHKVAHQFKEDYSEK